MSLETDLATAITALCSRCYPDTAPHDTARPYVTWQQVGGPVQSPIDGSAPFEGARMQINVWADSRKAANELMQSIAAALRVAPLHARPTSALIARREDIADLYGAQQDFLIWRT